MNELRPKYLVLALALTFSSVAAVAADSPTKTIKSVPARDIQTLDGKAMFHEYCAVCHGDNGKGNGPAADALKKEPSDLTRVALNNGGTFPEIKVQRLITGEDEVAAHGNRAMPVWGNIFRSMSNKEGETLRVNALMKYVEQMQAK
jgi:mono/diheme cytochrome c family protein